MCVCGAIQANQLANRIRNERLARNSAANRSNDEIICCARSITEKSRQIRRVESKRSTRLRGTLNDDSNLQADLTRDFTFNCRNESRLGTNRRAVSISRLANTRCIFRSVNIEQCSFQSCHCPSKNRSSPLRISSSGNRRTKVLFRYSGKRTR